MSKTIIAEKPIDMLDALLKKYDRGQAKSNIYREVSELFGKDSVTIRSWKEGNGFAENGEVAKDIVRVYNEQLQKETRPENVVVEIKEGTNRVAGNDSIVAFDSGAYYDHNGGVTYSSTEELLKAHPKLGIESSEASNTTANTAKSVHNAKEVTKTAQYFKGMATIKTLDEYLPFYDRAKIIGNVGATKDGQLTVAWYRPVLGGANKGTHFSMLQVRGDNPKWKMVKGSDSKTVEIATFNNDTVYCVCGTGDFLVLKSTGLNYMAFASDTGAKNSHHRKYIQEKIGNRKVKLIADLDSSGFKVKSYLEAYDISVELFNWSKINIAKKGADLRDIAAKVKESGGDINTLKDIITGDKAVPEALATTPEEEANIATMIDSYIDSADTTDTGYDEIFLDVATGKYVFEKELMTVKHDRNKALLLLDKAKAKDILDNVPKYFSEYNPTRGRYFKNRNNVDAINLFKPSKYVRMATKADDLKMPDAVGFLLNHLIQDSETKAVFINALANHLQNGTSIHTGWIFAGIEGAGKGLLLQFIFEVFGVHNSQKSKLANFTGDKVKGIVEKLIGFIDESAESKIMYEVVENLKAIIANTTFSSRALHQNEVDVLNFAMYFFCVNSFGFKLSANDRRMNIISCNKKLADEVEDISDFVTALLSEVQNFTNYLLSHKVDKGLITKIVYTDFRQQMITANLPINERIARCLIDGNLDAIADEVDDDSSEYKKVQEKLQNIKQYDKVQGSVLSKMGEDIFDLTPILSEHYKKNTITKILKDKYVYTQVKMHGGSIKCYIIGKGDNKLSSHMINEAEITAVNDKKKKWKNMS